MNVQCHRELSELGRSEVGVYLVKLIFGEYFCYFDSNRVAVLLQLYLDTNRILVCERVNEQVCTLY